MSESKKSGDQIIKDFSDRYFGNMLSDEKLCKEIHQKFLEKSEELNISVSDYIFKNGLYKFTIRIKNTNRGLNIVVIKIGEFSNYETCELRFDEEHVHANHMSIKKFKYDAEVIAYVRGVMIR